MLQLLFSGAGNELKCNSLLQRIKNGMNHLQLDPKRRAIYWIIDGGKLVKITFDCNDKGKSWLSAILSEKTNDQCCFFYLGSDEEVIYEKEGLGSFAINHDKAVIWLTDISNNKLIEINIIGEDKKTR